METRVCKVCENQLSLQCFSQSELPNGSVRIRHQCKSCRSLLESKRRMENIEMFIKKDKEYYRNNKETILERNREYRRKNTETIKAQKKDYYQSNKDSICEYHKKHKEQRNERLKVLRATNIEWRITQSLRARVHDVLQRYKSTSFSSLLGCTHNHLKIWLQSQFVNGMDFENYGSYWHIDHIIPVSVFDINDKIQQLLCFNWSNLRPLQVHKNLQKSNKLLMNDIIHHANTVCNYILHIGYQGKVEILFWRRVSLRYGNNPKDEENFESFLKWAIRNEASNV